MEKEAGTNHAEQQMLAGRPPQQFAGNLQFMLRQESRILAEVAPRKNKTALGKGIKHCVMEDVICLPVLFLVQRSTWRVTMHCGCATACHVSQVVADWFNYRPLKLRSLKMQIKTLTTLVLNKLE